jgi:ABC-type Mn2+/Zn2+ transport system permease subunit
MIADFLESWGLFRWTYLAGVALAVVLSIAGVVVVTRGQVFIAAAISQASLLGLAVNLWFGWGSPVVAATAFSGAAALVTARRGSRRIGAGGEESTAWVFLVCASLAILVLARQPVGLKEVQSMMASSVLGATPREAVVFGVLALVGLTVPVVAGRRLALLVTDPTMAAAVGTRVGAWGVGIAVVLGLVTGLAVQATGLLFAFGCLVLPALVAKNLCRDVGPMFWVAPAVGVVAVLFGFLVAHRLDYPPGQVVVAVLAVVLAGAWGWRAGREWLFG